MATKVNGKPLSSNVKHFFYATLHRMFACVSLIPHNLASYLCHSFCIRFFLLIFFQATFFSVQFANIKSIFTFHKKPIVRFYPYPLAISSLQTINKKSIKGCLQMKGKHLIKLETYQIIKI